MNRTTSVTTLSADEGSRAATQDADELVERVRRTLDVAGQAQPPARGWLIRVQRTSPLDTRYVAR